MKRINFQGAGGRKCVQLVGNPDVRRYCSAPASPGYDYCRRHARWRRALGILPPLNDETAG